MVGSLVADQIEPRVGRARSLAIRLPGGILLVATPAFTTNPYLVAVAFFVSGMTNGLFNVVAVLIRQRITPDRMLGRINSGYRLAAWGTRPIGAAAGGLIGQALGLRAVFLIDGGVILLTLAGMVWVNEGTIKTAEENADH